MIAQIGARPRHERAPRDRRRRASCSRRRSSTRTCICARRAARTRRRSRAAPPRRPQAATARSSRSRTPTRWSTTPTSCAACAHAPRPRRTCRSGFMAAITKGQDGAELTEMGALADAGAAGFTDDGRPVAAAGVMRRALQYNAVTGRMIAVHCEEATLTRGGHAHAGAVAAELGLGGWPSLGESLMVARDLDLAGETGQAVHLMHLSARESVDHLRRAHAAGVRASAEATPHHLCLTDEAVRTLDANMKMNPPLRSEDDRTRAARRAARRHDRRDRDRPRAALARGEGRAVRGGAVRRHRPRDRVRRRSTPTSSSRGSCRSRRCSADVGRPCGDLRARPAADRGRRAGEPDAHRPGRQLAREGVERSARARRTRGCSASGCAAASR